jgi:hypothetical protein
VSLVTLIEYADASAEVRAVYDDIMRTRGADWINNFWKALANDPVLLRAPGERKAGDGARCARPAREGDDLHGGERDQQLRVLHVLATPPPQEEGHERRSC